MCTIPFGDSRIGMIQIPFRLSPFSVPNRKGDHILCVKMRLQQPIKTKSKDYPE